MTDEGATAGEATRPRGIRHNPWVLQHKHRIDMVLRLVVVGGIGLLVSRELRMDIGPLPALVALLPWVAVVCVGIAFAGWRIRVPMPAFGALVVAAVIVAQWVPAFTVDSAATVAPKAQHLRVMAFNSAANPAAFAVLAKEAQRRDVDVLLVVEAVPAIHDELPYHALSSAFSYQYLDINDQVGIWSRQPLDDVTTLPMYFGGKSARLNLGGVDVTIIAAHTQSPRYTHATPWRRDQRALRTFIDQQPAGSLLLAGDLNMTRDHGWFRDYLSSGFVDAADMTGAGWKGTWSYGADNWPFVTIDHLLGRGLAFGNYDTVPIHGSDHRAIVADISVSRA